MSFFAILIALLLEQARPLAHDNAVHSALRAWARIVRRNLDAGETVQGWMAWVLAAGLPALLSCAGVLGFVAIQHRAGLCLAGGCVVRDRGVSTVQSPFHRHSPGAGNWRRARRPREAGEVVAGGGSEPAAYRVAAPGHRTGCVGGPSPCVWCVDLFRRLLGAWVGPIWRVVLPNGGVPRAQLARARRRHAQRGHALCGPKRLAGGGFHPGAGDCVGLCDRGQFRRVGGHLAR